MKPFFAASGKPVIRRLVFLAYTAVVLAATLAPLSGNAYEAVAGLDKIVHVGLFGGVALLMCWNLAALNLRSAMRVFMMTVVFAALIELVQGTLRYRSGDIGDLLAGAFGAMLGVGCGLLAAYISTRPSE